jgi:hypothetical protein
MPYNIPPCLKPINPDNKKPAFKGPYKAKNNPVKQFSNIITFYYIAEEKNDLVKQTHKEYLESYNKI